MVAQQLMNSRERYVKSNKYNKIPDHGILVGDLVLVKDHTAKSFQPKYKEDFQVVQVYGTNALQVSDKRGKLHNVHITDVRKINMTEKIAAQLQEAYNNKGRTAKHLIPQGRIPDLGWNTDQQGKERQKLPNTKFARFAPIPRELREFHTLRTKLTHMLLSFRSLTIAREPKKIGAN